MKRFLIVILALMLVISLAACGGEPKTMDIAAVKTQILEQVKPVDPLDLPGEQLSELYGIAPEDVKTSACFITMGGAFPDEVVLVEAVDAAAADRIAEKLQQRLDDVTNQAQNYDADSFALLKKCKVQKIGTYLALFISAENSTMQSIFSKAAK